MAAYKRIAKALKTMLKLRSAWLSHFPNPRCQFLGSGILWRYRPLRNLPPSPGSPKDLLYGGSVTHRFLSRLRCTSPNQSHIITPKQSTTKLNVANTNTTASRKPLSSSSYSGHPHACGAGQFSLLPAHVPLHISLGRGVIPIPYAISIHKIHHIPNMLKELLQVICLVIASKLNTYFLYIVP